MPVKKSLADLEALLTPTVTAQGVELYDIEYLTEYGKKILRLYIDSKNGVGLDDCERVSHAVEPVLDADDPISEAYVLQVSSPGIERKLVKGHHFSDNIGAQVEVRLNKPFVNDDGIRQKKFRGELLGMEDDTLRISVGGRVFEFERGNVVYCKLSITTEEVCGKWIAARN